MQEAFFELLKSSLFGTAPEYAVFTDDLDWKSVFDTAHKQTVLPLVADAASRLPAHLQPDAAIMAKVRSMSLQAIILYGRLNGKLAEMSAFYASEGICGVVLKGQGVAMYYPAPELRHGGDIDFYVGDAVFDKAVDLAVNRWQDGKRDTDQEVYKHYEFETDDVCVEIHRAAALALRPWLRRRFAAWQKEWLEDRQRLDRISVGGTEVYRPAADFDAVYIFYHAFKHLIAGEGLGLRQLCDWAMVLHAANGIIDRKQIERTLKDFGLMRQWQILGYILVKYLGLPASEMPFYSERYAAKSERLFAMIMQGGNFGFFRPDRKRARKGFWNAKFATFRTFRQNLGRMWFLSPKDVAGSFCWYTVTGFWRAIRRRHR